MGHLVVNAILFAAAELTLSLKRLPCIRIAPFVPSLIRADRAVNWIAHAATFRNLYFGFGSSLLNLAHSSGLILGLAQLIISALVCSNYTDPNKVWENVQKFKGGNAIFTQPTTPIKCGGAPQKIMYLADDYWAKQGVKNKTKVVFATPGSVIFGVPEFAKTLTKVLQRKEIHFKPFYAITKIDVANKEVHFKNAKPGDNACTVNEGEGLGERLDGDSTFVLPFDFLHLAPPSPVKPDAASTSTPAPKSAWLPPRPSLRKFPFFS